MPRISVTLPNDTYDKLQAYAQKNDESLSNVIAKMAEFGFEIKRSQQGKSGSGMSKIDEHSAKLIIQMNAIIKELAEKNMGYNKGKFDTLKIKTVQRFNELTGAIEEEL